MRKFIMDRMEDIHGKSGTGIVAEGVEWTDGTVTVRWLTEYPCTVNWDNVSDLEAVHGHEGSTTIVFVD